MGPQIDVGVAGRNCEAPITDIKERHCKICSVKLSIYNVNSRYCFAHKWKGTKLEDTDDTKRLDKRFKERKRYERKKNGNKPNNK